MKRILAKKKEKKNGRKGGHGFLVFFLVGLRTLERTTQRGIKESVDERRCQIPVNVDKANERKKLLVSSSTAIMTKNKSSIERRDREHG